LTRSADGTPVLRNLIERPGVSGLEELGLRPQESLQNPWSAPSKIPVNGWLPVETNLHFETTPTGWMYFVLATPVEANTGIASAKV